MPVSTQSALPPNIFYFGSSSLYITTKEAHSKNGLKGAQGREQNRIPYIGRFG